MTTISVGPMMLAPIQARRYTRNGLLVDAGLQTGFCTNTNQAIKYRVKEVFHNHGMMGFDTGGTDVMLTPSATDRDRWIFRCHSSQYARRFYVRMLCCQYTSVGFGPSGNAAARFRVTTPGGTIIGDSLFNFGTSAVAMPQVPSSYGVGTGYIDISANQDYVGIFTDTGGSLLVSATVWEISLDPDTSNGYLPSNYAAQGAIYDVDRSGPSTALSNVWKHSGYPCFNWTVNSQASPQVSNILTYQNVIDLSSTGHDATTPGWTVDLTNCARLSQATSGVPAMLYVFGKWSGATTGGTVRLLDTGSFLASTTLSGFNTTGQWLSTAVNLYPGSDKYDLQIASTAGGTNFSVYAASLFLYEA